MNPSVSTQKNGLRTYRPPLEKFVFESEEFKKRVLTWVEGVKSGNTSRALLLTGAPGLGKTTLGLALCEALGTHENDVQEINCGASGGVDYAREIVNRLNFQAGFGDFRVLILDEVQKLTPQAQSVFLTPIEKLQGGMIIIACTSAPEALDRAFRSRFYEIRFQPYSDDAVTEALENLPTPPAPKQIATIVKMANGNMRKAIDLAEGGIGPEDAQTLRAIQAIELFYPLLLKGEFPTLMFAITQIGDNERRTFFTKNLNLLEGTWMTLMGQSTTLQMNDQSQVAKLLAGMTVKPAPALIARYYKDLAMLQDKPIELTKAWIMTLQPSKQ